nr:hypothetical protein [Tanacetum cinerariifolium]
MRSMNTAGYEIQSSFALITPNDQGFTVDRNMDDFLVTENFGMILRKPVHTDDNGAYFIEWEVSIVPIVFSWCGSIGFDSFLPSVLLWLVVIVAVVGYVNGFLLSLRFRGGNISFDTLSQMIKFVFHLLDLSPGRVLLYQKFLEFNLGFLLALSAFAMVAACVSRAAATLSTTSCLMAA